MNVDRENEKAISNLSAMMPKIIEETVLNALEKIALLILEEVKEQEGFNNVTFNLEDSFGCGIYHKGILRKIVYANDTPEATVSRKRGDLEFWGRSEAERFFKSYKFENGADDFNIVVAGVMYYAKYLQFYHNLNVLTDSWISTKSKLKNGQYVTVFKQVSKEVLKKYFK